MCLRALSQEAPQSSITEVSWNHLSKISFNSPRYQWVHGTYFYTVCRVGLLTHLPLVLHLYASLSWVSIGSDNGLAPGLSISSQIGLSGIQQGFADDKSTGYPFFMNNFKSVIGHWRSEGVWGVGVGVGVGGGGWVVGWWIGGGGVWGGGKDRVHAANGRLSRRDPTRSE